jgi:hypothetical protein
MGLLSFDDYGAGKNKPVKEKRSERRRRRLNEKKKVGSKKPSKTNTKLDSKFKTLENKINNIKKKNDAVTNTNESAFQVGDDFKVKVTLDVPISLVKEYIDKVKEETGKNPLDNFSESELAEQMVDFVVKQNLVIDNLPANFSVGDENVDDSAQEEQGLETAEQDAEDLEQEDETGDAEADSEEVETDAGDSEESDGLTGMTDDDIEDAGDEDDELEFDGEEIELGEDIEVDDSKESEDKKETEEEEESLTDLFEKITYSKDE